MQYIRSVQRVTQWTTEVNSWLTRWRLQSSIALVEGIFLTPSV
jgi:hypothetical protein